jgi:hypothetical protein
VKPRMCLVSGRTDAITRLSLPALKRSIWEILTHSIRAWHLFMMRIWVLTHFWCKAGWALSMVGREPSGVSEESEGIINRVE